MVMTQAGRAEGFESQDTQLGQKGNVIFELGAGQIPALPNHFIFLVDHSKRSHFREGSSREPLLSLP